MRNNDKNKIYKYEYGTQSALYNIECWLHNSWYLFIVQNLPVCSLYEEIFDVLLFVFVPALHVHPEICVGTYRPIIQFLHFLCELKKQIKGFLCCSSSLIYFGFSNESWNLQNLWWLYFLLV